MIKRPIVSPMTAYILLQLLDGCQPSTVLAKNLGKFPSEINKYLHYYLNKKILTKQGDIWCLSEFGSTFVKERLNYLINIVSVFGMKVNEKESIVHSAIEKIKDLDGPCVELVKFLFNYYKKTGRLYFETQPGRLFDELSEAISSSNNFVGPYKIAECVKELNKRAVVYVYKNYKIRLDRSLLK